MRVQVDAAGQDELAGGVDLLRRARDLPDGCDATAVDTDVGDRAPRRGDDAAAADR
ncbi:MAG TPA: hypothetical protein VJP45_05985 [Candidatus Limnocylindria bacterium]|nr:hypothetical protein [Candidatus Limnocylindria bacterium]